jgi:hypothetical protein
MASSSLSIRDAPPPGFKWILVCNNCKYYYCFDCLVCSIKSSPACINILNNWVQSCNHQHSYYSYFRYSHNVARGIMSGGPYQGQVYFVLYTPCITYEDYCKIMLQTKYDGSCWIIFECSTFKDTPIWWSGWLYILYWTYCPRDADFFGASKEAFIQWFRAEIEEATHHEGWFVFNLSFLGSELQFEKTKPAQPPSYKVISEYFGDLCVPEDELIPAMQGSPFYKCFSGLPPFSKEHSSPPSSHFGYDSDASFDSVAEYNIVNRMEA